MAECCLPRIDWGKGVWQRALEIYELRKKYVHVRSSSIKQPYWLLRRKRNWRSKSCARRFERCMNLPVILHHPGSKTTLTVAGRAPASSVARAVAIRIWEAVSSAY